MNKALVNTGIAKKRGIARLGKFLPLYVMMIPCIVYLVVFKYLPILGNVIAFQNYNIVKGIWASSWAKPFYKHFYTFFYSSYFTQLMRNTLVLSATKLFFNTVSSILMALFLNEVRNKAFKRVVQTIVYMPHFLSWVIIYGILLSLFSQSNGLVNLLLDKYFGVKLAIFNSNTPFFWTLVLSSIWKSAGWGAIVYLAAITGVDPTLYEAARIDGANRWQCIWHVTLSGIRSTIVVMMILNLGSIMNAGFDQVFVMYNIQVYEVSDIIDTWVYRTGLTQLNYSLSTAVSLFKTVISFILVMTVNWIAKRFEEGLW